ncbi:iron ABC transporter substrate-binding protein [Peribacillus asahii]|uniref:Iron ABC transporter substrate-binding protein n=2 Tax=Peribacillus asahii TaxID=228899 RepID=A0A3Q9RR18_9BACI|nr:iron ABC transporter substrate-binding protein [Peribacillus asahii]
MFKKEKWGISMKKLSSLSAVLVLSVGLMAGCGDSSKEENASTSKGNEPTATQAFPVTIKDAAGEEVTIEKEPKKIVSLIPSNTEIVFELGAGDNVVGVSDNDNYPKEVEKIEKIGGMEMNTEKVIAMEPDLVLAHASNAHNGSEGIKQLKEVGIPVLVVNDSQNFEQVYESIEMIGQATGENEAAEELVQDMQEDLKEIEEKAKAVTEQDRKKVLIEVSPAPEIYSPGKNTFMNEMLQIIGADNVAGDLEGWAKIDEESMIAANPDVIVTTYGYYTEDPVAQVKSRNGWEDVTAIKQEQIYDVHSDLVTRSGPRLVEGVEELAEAIYPEIFN